MSGLDSAMAPTVEQVRAALDQGYLWWGFYCGGPGAYRNWTRADVDVLYEGGMRLAVPIWVPKLIWGLGGWHIDPNANPELDAARACYYAAVGYGVEGTVCLDTEYSMRGYSWTDEYEARFGDEVAKNVEPSTYAGGFTLDHPPKHKAWWILPGRAAPNTCHQTGMFVEVGGLVTDTDSAGAGFPLGTIKR